MVYLLAHWAVLQSVPDQPSTHPFEHEPSVPHCAPSLQYPHLNSRGLLIVFNLSLTPKIFNKKFSKYKKNVVNTYRTSSPFSVLYVGWFTVWAATQARRAIKADFIYALNKPVNIFALQRQKKLFSIFWKFFKNVEIFRFFWKISL